MATRGARTIRATQITPTELRDSNFDANHKINEDKIDIDWNGHTETLLNKKIDVFVQKDNVNVAGLDSVEITSDMGSRVVSTGSSVEGVVTESLVILREHGTQDTPIPDTDADPAYGKIRYDETESKWYLDFFSLVAGVEQPFTMPTGMVIDYKWVLRTNLLNAPVDIIVNGGNGFVEGATDARAYHNLLQLAKDLYGASGHLDDDGNANLTDQGYGASVLERVNNFIAAIASVDTAKGATLIGVTVNSDYTGATVQAVLNDLADRLVLAETQLSATKAEVEAIRSRDAATTNAYFAQATYADAEERIENVETVVDTQFKAINDKVNTHIGNFDELVVEADGSGTQTTFTIPASHAKTVQVSLNGVEQYPVLNYDRTLNGSNQCIGVTIPVALGYGPAPDNIPDAVRISFIKV